MKLAAEFWDYRTESCYSGPKPGGVMTGPSKDSIDTLDEEIENAP